MPGMSGVKMAHVIKLRSAATPVLMCTRKVPEDTSCIDLVFERPVHPLRLKDAAERSLTEFPPRNPGSLAFFSSVLPPVSFGLPGAPLNGGSGFGLQAP